MKRTEGVGSVTKSLSSVSNGLLVGYYRPAAFALSLGDSVEPTGARGAGVDVEVAGEGASGGRETFHSDGFFSFPPGRRLPK